MKLERLDEKKVEKLHEALRGISIRVPKEPTFQNVRATISQIRAHRNQVINILGKVLPRLGRLKAHTRRAQRALDHATAQTMEGGLGPERAHAARLLRTKARLHEEHDAVAALEEDVLLLTELVGHAKIVREELEAAFQETSRTLATLEMEWKVETSRTS